MTLQQRLDKAAELRTQGYNCAQSVILAFPDVTGLDNDLAARLTAALGAGLAASGEVCGVVNAMSIVQGLRGGSSPADKGPATLGARSMIDSFTAETDGRIRCRDLKTPPQKISCNDLVAKGVRIVHNHIGK